MRASLSISAKSVTENFPHIFVNFRMIVASCNAEIMHIAVVTPNQPPIGKMSIAAHMTIMTINICVYSTLSSIILACNCYLQLHNSTIRISHKYNSLF